MEVQFGDSWLPATLIEIWESVLDNELRYAYAVVTPSGNIFEESFKRGDAYIRKYNHAIA